DKNSNAVYIGTNKGMVEYRSDAVPSEDNYDNVYAYPNPVRPDYTGDIIIRGLMDNSMVKICDSVGNIVYSTTSNGGMVVWNGCNYNGRRVDTGVYFVMASTNATGSSEGCVTKILVVR
ncbi:MAG: Por secretion system protein, partial [Muribaculaceae bacterium]|nr:Por secretion system protein [Muribaculaceae bacterium]